MATHPAREILTPGLCLLALACTGKIDDPTPRGTFGVPGGTAWGPGATGLPGDPLAAGPASGAAGAGFAGAPPGEPATGPRPVNVVECLAPAVGPSPMARLTHREYDNSVRDLLGVDLSRAREFAPDTRVGLFDNTASTQTVSVLLADQYLSSAEELARVADVDGLLGCDASDTGCVRGFVERFGRRAYRRPLASDEVDRLLALHADVAAASDGRTGVRGVITAVLASPDFLFRPEGAGSPSALPGALNATSFELAARLSSLLWASVPDDALLDAASAGLLEDPAELEAQARRMLADPRARVAMADFYAQWFGLETLATATKDPAAYPEFDDTLRASMAEETRRYVDHVLWQDDATLTTLLTAPYSFVDGRLAALYGLAPPADPAAFERSALDGVQRLGLLSQGSLMTAFASTAESSPVKRGKWVRVRVLCQDLPDPPADIPDLPAPAPGVSTRERFAMHTANPACSGCHGLIDGLGFGLEHYDGIGAYRTLDQGVAVDASGEVNSTRDIDGSYTGAPELAMRLASSGQVQDCAPTQWLRYTLGRRETADDACSLVALREAFAASGGDLRELMVAITQTDAFRSYRAQE